ncbi:MAG: D-alanyl-D-alanine carboxypeptidase family protein [Oscillospiraceae bacterium]|nr:D-alanyl-D-alanine carboxypeptidase family protein [Oscillospiraceae bacterium]
MKKKEKKPRRHLSFGGFVVFSVMIIGGVWLADGAIRAFHKQPDSYPAGEGIIPEGTFADSESSDNVTLDNDPEEAAKEAGKAEVQPTTEIEIKEAAAPVPKPTLPANCVAVPLDTKEIGNGKLLQLDCDHPFRGSATDLSDFSEKSENYLMRVNDLPIRNEVVTALNKMTAAYVMVMEQTDLMVYSTTERVSDVCLYSEELPDSVNGYCVDLCYYTEDGDIIGINYENNPWLTNNAYLYGFVRSYTRADSEVTGVDSAPYHLRYVGKVHSMIMHEEDLTLTAYIDVLSHHPITDPYYWDDGSTVWSVYYVPATAGTTEVPVPLNANYEISGNNVDGFIVTAEGKIGE